jgi:hypothetical protein
VQDLAPVFDAMVIVVASKIQPNMPLTDMSTIQDPQTFIALVQDRHTVYVVVPGGISPVIIVVVAVLVIALIVILCNRKAEPPPPPEGLHAHFPTPPLESIRITKENFKPYIKTA